MDLDSIGVVALVIGILLTIASCIFIVPKSRRKDLNGFFAKVHDIFNFKGLMLESILKALYVFFTFYFIVFGFFYLFNEYGDFGENFLNGIVCMVAGPILTRVVFELVMMFVLLVKNVIDINNKLGGTAPTVEAPVAEAPKAEAPKAEAPKAERNVFCTGCGKAFADDSDFCVYCGAKRN